MQQNGQEMKIESPYTEYYDHIARQYGGGDPKTTYQRDRVTRLIDQDEALLKQRTDYSPLHPVRDHHYVRDYAILVFCGRPYSIESQRYCTLDDRNAYWTGKPLVDGLFGWRLTVEPVELEFRYFGRGEWGKLQSPQAEHEYLAIARRLKCPVFWVDSAEGPDRWKYIQVRERVPKLSEIQGFPARFPAEQVYQDIAYFLGNTIHENPDGMPVPKLSNDEKIVSQGFDPRRSFRPKMR